MMMAGGIYFKYEFPTIEILGHSLRTIDTIYPIVLLLLGAIYVWMARKK